MPDLRMPDTNLVIIAGRLTRDPDLRYTPSNRAYCKIGIAASKKYKTKSGEAREDTTFVDGTAWDKTAEIIAEYMRKGQAVIMEGRLTTNTWEKDGKQHSKLEVSITRVQSLEWGDSKTPMTPADQPPRVSRPNTPAQTEIKDDDIPF